MSNHTESPFCALISHDDWLEQFCANRPSESHEYAKYWLKKVCALDCYEVFNVAHATRPRSVYVASSDNETGGTCLIAYFATPYTWYATKIMDLPPSADKEYNNDIE